MTSLTSPRELRCLPVPSPTPLFSSLELGLAGDCRVKRHTGVRPVFSIILHSPHKHAPRDGESVTSVALDTAVRQHIRLLRSCGGSHASLTGLEGRAVGHCACRLHCVVALYVPLCATCQCGPEHRCFTTRD